MRFFFGLTFKDGVPCGKDIRSSKTLTELWGHGFASFGNVTMASAGYVAGYCTKKVTGEIASLWYTRLNPDTGELLPVTPEFGRMSLKPGIGYEWFKRYWKDVYSARDGVVLPGGKKVPPPKYYDRLLADLDGDLREEKDFERYINSATFAADCTAERLLVRETCAKAREKFKKREVI